MTKGTVLLVEDNIEVAKSSAELLHSYGYNVEVAPGATMAMRTLVELDGKVDILFTDIRLGPGEDGVSLAGEVQEHYPHVKIVITTGYSSRYNESVRMDWTLVRKPYSVRHLDNLFQMLLDQENEHE